MNKKLTKLRRVATTATIIIFVLSTLATIMPTAQAATNVTLSWTLSHEIIGVNQPLVLGIIVSADSFASVYGVTWDQNIVTKEKVWPTAYVVFTRPDGTTDTVKGPFDLGIAHRPRFEYTPNMVGLWTAKFVWPGDNYYNAASVERKFEVSQKQIAKRDVWAILSLRPDDIIGLNQNLMINAWVTPPPLTGAEVFDNYMFTITKPNGEVDKVGPMWSEGPGTVWFEYPMSQLGKWTIKFDFPGDVHNKPASTTSTITVQQEPVQMGYPDTPLPTDEWKFPINVENREWRNIAGPWYQSNYDASVGAFNPYTEAPRSAHILWEIPGTGIGGYAGSPHSIQTGSGEAVYGAGDAGIFTGSAPTIRTVMAGRGYYTTGGNIICVDMRTGQKLWQTPGSFNAGAIRSRTPVLYQFGSRFIVYDAITGAMTLNTTGLSMAYFQNPYVISVSGKNLIKWDVGTSTTNFTSRIVWNITNPLPTTSSGHSLIQKNLIIARRFPQQTILTDALIAVNMTTGKLEYNTTIMDWTDVNSWIYRQGPAIGSGFGKVYFAGIPYPNQGYGYYCFDALTGRQVWTSEKTNYPWGEFWAYMPQASAYNMNFGLSYDGVYAFNLDTGKIVWHYTAEDPYHETPYNQYVFGSTGPVVGGGIVFAPNTEHSPTFYYRGQQLHAIDAFTGTKVWSIKGTYTPTAVAYGTLIATDTPNGITYAFGKGSTQTTISTSEKISGKGNPLLIEGTVTDQSEAQKGTPAISDQSMTAWMEYVHMQQPKPTDATGVPVKLTATDANGNTQEIGTTMSNVNGQYSMMWTPPQEGKLVITATFAGSDSYYPSSAETAIGVSPAPTPISTPEPVKAVNQVSAEAFYAFAVAIIALIAVIAVLFYRKK